jgi:hypothetical protein
LVIAGDLQRRKLAVSVRAGSNPGLTLAHLQERMAMTRLQSFKRGAAVSAGIMALFVGIGVSLTPTVAKDVPYGKPADVAYAEKLWPALVKERLVGPNRIVARPTKGEQPHGALQQIMAATATVDGVERRVVVKANFRGANLKEADVYANPTEGLSHFAVMAKREAGYDPAHADWFWVVYDAAGNVARHAGVAIAGRADTGDDRGCIGCHKKYGGKDYEMLTTE